LGGVRTLRYRGVKNNMNLEYKVHKFSTIQKDWRKALEKSLNEFAKRGWELDQIMYEHNHPDTIFLKRLKPKK